MRSNKDGGDEQLHVPDTWDEENVGGKRKSSKKQKSNAKKTKFESIDDGENYAVTETSMDSTEEIIQSIARHVGLSAQKPGCSIESGIYLEGILSFFSYHELLTNIFSDGIDDKTKYSVPLITKKYEEEWMRECGLYPDDAPCALGSDMCECMQIDEQNAFVGVQFRLPVQMQDGLEHTAERENKLCVLCCRKQTQALFYDAIFNQRSYACLIQLYGNISDVEGEYSRHVMLSMPPTGPISSMPLPIVSHQRNRYSVERKQNGLRYMIQHRVSYESFCQPCP